MVKRKEIELVKVGEDKHNFYFEYPGELNFEIKILEWE